MFSFFRSRSKHQQEEKPPHFEVPDLCAEQEARIPELAQKWARRSAGTEPVDLEAVKTSVQALYAALGLAQPQDFRHYPSPRAVFDDVANWKDAVTTVSAISWEGLELPDGRAKEGKLAPGLLWWVPSKMSQTDGIGWFEPWFDEVDTGWLGERWEQETGIRGDVYQDSYDGWVLCPDTTAPLAASAEFFAEVVGCPLEEDFSQAIQAVATHCGLLFTMGNLVLVVERPTAFAESAQPEGLPTPVYAG
ncbi:MAG: hypothetical protein KC910_13210 [Candidatus Eremiobacteraeota bacterium]|nr:hypothetical protein [Candidatus Eremiobacteraeota bacterium]